MELTQQNGSSDKPQIPVDAALAKVVPKEVEIGGIVINTQPGVAMASSAINKVVMEQPGAAEGVQAAAKVMEMGKSLKGKNMSDVKELGKSLKGKNMSDVKEFGKSLKDKKMTKDEAKKLGKSLSQADLEGPKVRIGRTPGEKTCFVADIACGEISKDCCDGKSMCIARGPAVGLVGACSKGEDGIYIDNGYRLSAGSFSFILCCFITTFKLGMDSGIAWTKDKKQFEMMGTGMNSEQGCTFNILGSEVGYVDRKKLQKYEERRLRRKAGLEQPKSLKEQVLSEKKRIEGEVKEGITNVAAIVDDAA